MEHSETAPNPTAGEITGDGGPENAREFNAAVISLGVRKGSPSTCCFEPKENERSVVTDVPCVLLQRTMAKEQCRRLIAAELPAAFIEEHGAVVVGNHLNA